MKRQIFYLMMLVATNATAQTADTMNVRLKSGVIVPYAVSSVNALTFSGVQGKDTMNVVMKSGPTIPYSVSLLDVIRFSNDKSSDTLQIRLNGGIVRYYPVSSLSGLTFIDWDKTSSVETLTAESAKQIALEQNFPNPFYRSTTISYYLPVRQDVTVSVYTLTGLLIVSLVNEQKDAGMHQVTWDASAVPEGIYVCRLKAGGSLKVKKMTLLKN